MFARAAEGDRRRTRLARRGRGGGEGVVALGEETSRHRARLGDLGGRAFGDELAALIVEKSKKIVYGDPMDPKTDLGTVIHAGSASLIERRVKDAVNELAQVYAELARLGAGLEYIDIGGGLGVDYDGSRTNFESSMNYTLQEYANDVVYRIASVCDARDIPHPTIISESGRAK